MSIPAYPLTWPEGWKRTTSSDRTRARFGKQSRAKVGGGWEYGRQLTINDAVVRLRDELKRMGINDDDLVISTDVKLRLDGLPRSDQREPTDPGAAVYWTDAAMPNSPPRCMAIDRYSRVADNLAAIAATLDAMRAIERHGGAEILNRAFTGFTAIGHETVDGWWETLQVSAHASTDEVRSAYRQKRSAFHPDRAESSGDADRFIAVQKAWAAFCKERGINE
jgi:hypothetical protein